MIAIIGAGIAGLSLAWELVKAGEAVTLFDAGTAGQGASGAATAYLEARPGTSPTRLAEQQAALSWPDYAAELQAQSGIDVGFRSGQLRVATDADLHRFEEDMAQRDALGWPVERLSPNGLRAREPMLGDVAAGAWLPDAHYVDGEAVCAALRALVVAGSGVLHEDTPIMGIASIGEGVALTTADGTVYHADKVILAAGLATNSIDGLPDDVPPLMPVRGVNLVFHRADLPSFPTDMVKHRKGNMVPRGDRLLVGTTYDRGEADLSVSDETIAAIRANAAAIMPALADAPLHGTVAGLRIKTADGALRVGRSSHWPAVHMTLAHAGSGYLRVPVLAPAMARFVMTGEATGPLAPLFRG